MHIKYKAIDPPGEAKPDLEIFVDYARRMEFKDKDGNALISWKNCEDGFNAWKKRSRTGLAITVE